MKTAIVVYLFIQFIRDPIKLIENLKFVLNLLWEKVTKAKTEQNSSQIIYISKIIEQFFITLDRADFA